VANEAAASISAYSINASTGALTPVSGSPFATGSGAESVVVDPAGQYLYASNVTASNHVAAYAITPSSGALTLVGSPVAAGTLPAGIAVDPSGQFVYAANDNSADISAYSASAGVLTPVGGGPFAAGSQPRSIAID
jgi:6-phosphogluconolactonase (cycloisomerase 2 family)